MTASARGAEWARQTGLKEEPQVAEQQGVQPDQRLLELGIL